MSYRRLGVSAGVMVLLFTGSASAQSRCSAAIQSLGSPSAGSFEACGYSPPGASLEQAQAGWNLARDLKAAQERIQQDQSRHEEEVRSQQRFYDWATERPSGRW